MTNFIKYRIVLADNQGSFAIDLSASSCGNDDLRANARLFSAAPALLAALQRIYLETGESSIANIALAAIDAARAE